MPAALEDLADHLPVDRVVVRDQHVQLAGMRRAPGVVAKLHHALAHLVDSGDRMQHVEELALLQRQLEHGRETLRQRFEARHLELARHGEHARRRGASGGAPEPMSEIELLARGVEERAVAGLAEAYFGDQARRRFLDGVGGEAHGTPGR